ncbi:MAG: nucleotide sugar dehydrogenase [Pirellulaceae bacterium]
MTGLHQTTVSTSVSNCFTRLDDSLKLKTAVIGVIGLGYVGLPLIRALVDQGWRTMGFDVDESKVQSLKSGRSYIKHIPAAWIQNWVSSRQFKPTSDFARFAEADVLVICVPTPLNDSRDPDLSFVEATVRQIATALRPGQLIVLESTTYPGTTRDILFPILNANDLQLGEEYFLAYSPEREDPGNPDFTASSIPKVVGGMDRRSLELACRFYEHVAGDVIPVSSCEVAEACKILENTYRSVNIAMVNELKLLFTRLGVNIWEVIEAAKSKPFGFQAFYPGPGLGGHCIPIDPFYLSWLARKHEFTARFIELAGEINTSMPAHVVQSVASALNEQSKSVRGSRICVLGVAYKKDVDDPRESPAFPIIKMLRDAGADVSYSDPHIPVLPKMRNIALSEMHSQELSEPFLTQLDCIVIVTDHSAFDYELIVRYAPLIVDTRNATQGIPSIGKQIISA